MAKKYYWLKLMNDFFQQPKMKKLRKLAGGDTFTIIYLKMQLLSLQTDGKLYFDGVEDTFAEELALTIDEDEDNVVFVLMYLQKQGLIVQMDERKFALPETMQCIGSETDSAERMRRLREQKKAEKTLAAQAIEALPAASEALQNDGQASQCSSHVRTSDTEKEIEIEIEIEKEIELEGEEALRASAGKPAASPKKSGKKTKTDTDEILRRYTTDEKTLELLRDWLKVRKAKRAPETEKALTLNLDKLESLSRESGLSVTDYLESVIARGWAAFYPVRDGVQQGQRQARQDERCRVKSEEEHAHGGHASGFGW